MKNLSLANKIETYISENREFTLQELYNEFGDAYKEHSIRARVYESNKIIRTGRGSYILAGIEIEAIVEQADTREHVYKLVESKINYDLIFLDPPYNLKGGKGGNRNLTDYALISPIEFRDIIIQATKLLKKEDSQIHFMIAGGKTSIKGAEEYIRMFEHTGLKLINKGTYTKLTTSGKVCNMGKYEMPAELILTYSKSGKERFGEAEKESMDYRFERPSLPRSGGYRTQKPLGLLKKLIERSTKVGESVLDLFAGSGVTLEAALLLGRKAHGVEVSSEAIQSHILPRLSIKKELTKRVQPTLF